MATFTFSYSGPLDGQAGQSASSTLNAPNTVMPEFRAMLVADLGGFWNAATSSPTTDNTKPPITDAQLITYFMKSCLLSYEAKFKRYRRDAAAAAAEAGVTDPGTGVT